MCSNDCLQRMFVNLQVVAQIQEGDKLSTGRDYLHVSNSAYLQGVSRYLSSDSRQATLEHLEKMLSCAQNFIHVAINDMDSKNVSHTQMDSGTILQCIQTDLSCSMTGVKNLAITYRADQTTVAKLQLLLANMTRQIERINCALESPPSPISG